MRLGLDMEALVALDEAATTHLREGDDSDLHVLEAGSRRLRVALTGTHAAPLAARRVHLPDADAAAAWESALARQSAAVAGAGVPELPAAVQAVATPGPARVLWIVRPRVPDDALLLPTLRRATPETARTIALALRDAAAALASTDGAAAPAEASAWAWLDGELVLVHNDLPHTLPAATLHGPWRWWAALLRGTWLDSGAPLTRDPTALIAGVLAPLATEAALEGVLPTLRPLLPDPVRETLLERQSQHTRWSRRLQLLRRPR